MTEAAIQEANAAFAKMVSGQLVRISGELNRLGEVLKAGRVDARVLSEFRNAAERVRTSGWQVQVWLEGDERALSMMLMEERIRQATRLAEQVASGIAGNGKQFLGMGALKEAVRKLDGML